MKIIEKNSWSIQHRCTGEGNGEGGCNSLLLLSKDDLFFNRAVCDGNSTRYILSFQCPICNLWTDVDDNKIPYNIKKELLFDEIGAYKTNIRRKIR